VTELRGRLLLDGELVPGRLRFDGGRYTEVEREERVAGADEPILAPGLVDLHVHGYGGHGPRVVDGEATGLVEMARALARAGTTAFQPTLFPAAPARLGADVEVLWRAVPDDALQGNGGGARDAARVLGFHLEGPFVSRGAAGALPVEDLATPSPAALAEILGPATGGGRGVRTMTVAPELPGASELVRELVRSGVRVSLGHSLASSAEARAAAAAGASSATHLYNAMAPFHHREAGLVGFALSDDALCAELIGDLVHVGPAAVELALRSRGPGGLALVSDALAGAGSGCAHFHENGRSHVVSDAVWFEPPEGGEPRLAGAAASQMEALRRLVGAGVVGVAEALTMASRTPARALGLEGELGVLCPGARADLLLLSAELDLLGVWIGGRRLGGSGSAESDR